MSEVKLGKSVFEGENIIAYAEDTYIVFDDNGQGQLVIPSIEKYKLSDGVRVLRGGSRVDLLCPNTKTLNHKNNQWSRVDEVTIECSECGCKMDISNIQGKATIQENK